MFVQPEAINYCVKTKRFKALDTGNEREGREGWGEDNKSLERVLISCVANDQLGDYKASRFPETVVLCWLHCKPRAVTMQI